MTRAPLNQIIRVRPEESDAIQLGTVAGKVADAGSRAAQIIRTYYLTDEIRGHMRKILTSIARGNAPSPGHLEHNAWLLDAGIGAGKSHFLAFLMVLLTQKKDAWMALIGKEDELGAKQRLDDKIILQGVEEKQHLVVPIDLTNEPTERSLAHIFVTNMKARYQGETKEPLAVEPHERLIDWFYKRPWCEDFQKWLRSKSVDEKKEGIQRKNHSPELANRIREYCTEHQIEPQLHPGWDDAIRLGCEYAIAHFNGGVIFIVDELSRYMARRKQASQDEADITTLQRIARNFREEGLQIWLVATENVATSKEVTQQIKGPGSIEPLTLNTQDFKDIVLYRCRSLPEDQTQREAAKAKIEGYWSGLKKKLNWVNTLSLEEFIHVFPYEPILIDLTRRVCGQMAETRTGIQILHSTLRHHATDNRLITADMVFDELEGKVEQEDAKANLFEETEDNRAVYRVCLDVFEHIKKSRDIPDGFKPKAINAVKALVILYFSQRGEFISAEDVMEILSEEWNENTDRKSAVIQFTGVLDELSAVSQGHIEKDKGGYRFSVEGQVSIKPEWDTEIDSLNKQPDGYNPRELLRQLISSEEELQTNFFSGLTLEGGTKTLSFKGLNWKGFSVKGVGRLVELPLISRLDPPNKRDHNQDFAMYVAIQNDEAKATSLLNGCNDERVIVWCPKLLSQDEVSELLAYDALQRIRKRFAKGERRDDTEKLAKANAELDERKPKIITTIKAAFNHGALRTKTQTLNVAKSDLQTALAAAVPHVLNDAYREHPLTIPGNQPLDDSSILKLANGFVRYERHDKNIPKDEWDAAKTFTKPLELASNAAMPELDISTSTYIARIKKQIEDNGGAIAFTILKESYCEKPHGLSPRLLSLYLLAMARKAEVVLETKSGIVSKNVIEQGLTISSGSKGYIDEIHTVGRSKAPEPWDKILDMANVLLSAQASPVRSDDNYAQLARDLQHILTTEYREWERWKTQLEGFIAKIDATSQLPGHLEQLQSILALSDLDKNPSKGLEMLWATVQDHWGDDPHAFATSFGDYRKVKEFLTLRKDDTVLFARQVEAAVPDSKEPQWADLRQAKAVCNAAFDCDGIIRENKLWDAYDKARSKLLAAYATVYTDLHTAYYQAVQTYMDDLTELRDGMELACLPRLESVPEIGGSEGANAKRAIDEALANTTKCSRVIDAQLKTAVRCECGVVITDSFTSDVAEECLGTLEKGLQQTLAALHSPDIKTHLLVAAGAKKQEGLIDLLNLKPNDTKRLIELAAPELVEWIRKALSTLRSVEIVVDGIPIPPSFPYVEAEAVAEAMKIHICKLIDEAIDRAGFREGVEAGKSVVVRVKVSK